jgi:hypothetical protein
MRMKGEDPKAWTEFPHGWRIWKLPPWSVRSVRTIRRSARNPLNVKRAFAVTTPADRQIASCSNLKPFASPIGSIPMISGIVLAHTIIYSINNG